MKDFKGFINVIGDFVSKKSPEILTGVGIAGMLTTTILAVKATPKAIMLMNFEKEIRANDAEKESACTNTNIMPEPLKRIDILKLTWKCYIPSVITATISAACLISANTVNSKRNAALAAVYSLSETALKEYRTKVIETIGEDKEKDIRTEITNGNAKKSMDNDPVTNKEVIIVERGGTLCYDTLSGRYFKSDVEKIKNVINSLNRQMLSEMTISLNDLYYELGLSETKIGDQIGWNIDKSLIEVSFSSQLTSDGSPCVVVNYSEVGYIK